MKYAVIALLIALTILSACSPSEEVIEPVVNETIIVNETPEISPITQPLVIEEVIPELQSFSVELLEKTKIKYEGVEYEFQIISANRDTARLEFTTPKETKEVTISRGKKTRLSNDISLYVSSLSIIRIPTQLVEARITLADWDKDEIYELEDKEDLTIDDTEVEIELDDFESGEVRIQIPSLQLKTTLSQGKTTVLGPFTITPITIDGEGKNVLASVQYDESVGLSYKVTREKTELVFDDDTYDVAFTNTFIDTTKSQPIQIEITVDGNEYELQLNKQEKIEGAKVTITQVQTFEDSDDDFILLKIE